MPTGGKVGLALGSGGARGIAHISVLEVLEENGIPIDLIAGSSMGAVIGGIYASGTDIGLCGKVIQELNERDYLDVVMPREGFIRGERFQELIRIFTKDKDFSETLMPFVCVAVDLEKGELVVLDEGKMHDAIRASISIPGIFVPHRYNGRILVDGGVISRVPTETVKAMGASAIIGVDVGYRGTGHNLKIHNAMDIISYALDIMEWEVCKMRNTEADIMITPEVSHYNFRDAKAAKALMELGRAAAEKALPDIFALLEEKKIPKTAKAAT